MSKIRYSIAEALFELIEQKVIVLPVLLPLSFIFVHLEFFVYNIKEIEFYFDFQQRTIHIVNPDGLFQYKGTTYSTDYRSNIDRPRRISLLKMYNKAKALKAQRRISWETIANNPYKARLEFRLTMYNSPDRSLANLDGSATDVIRRYTPYLATLYYRQFFGKVTADTFEHPLFGEILDMAAEGKSRYRGHEIEKAQTHIETFKEKCFFDMVDTFFAFTRTNAGTPSNMPTYFSSTRVKPQKTATTKAKKDLGV
jgi:hypothetical protein